MDGAELPQIRCARAGVDQHSCFGECAGSGRGMSKQESGYDYDRYRKLLAEANDDTKRLELIDLMIKEGARDKLEAQRTSDRVAMTAVTVAKILGPGGRRDDFRPD
jgi:hypothetical protein